MEQTEKIDRLEGLIKKYGPHSCGIYDIRNVDGDIEWLISEVERWKELFRKYGDHVPMCAIKYSRISTANCNCGFDQVLKESDSEAILRNSLNKGVVDGGNSLPVI